MKKIPLILAILLIFTLPSCSKRENPSCRAVLARMIESEVGLPAGKVYSMHAQKGNAEFLPEYLIDCLYGNGERPIMADGWLDLAIFLPSSQHPCEFAVFLCDCEDTATDTARMLCQRLDVIRSAKNDEKNSVYLDNATVAVIRNYVLFIISSDTENALKIARKSIG